MSSSSVGGGSKSERRLLMEAKASVGAAIAEVRWVRETYVCIAPGVHSDEGNCSLLW